MGRLVVAATMTFETMTFETMTFDMITELIYNMTIHITTYDTCVYVDNSVDFVDYLRFFIKKTTDGSKMMYNSKRMDVDK